MFSVESLTPEKSQIITKIKGKNVTQRIKYINQKGTFKRTGQCENCQFCGKVQIGLGFALDISCDREKGFWKMHSGKTDKPCKYAQPIVREEVDSK
jgi:hypothetical protein